MPPEVLPENIGPYHIVGLLGKGGMGSVYKAYKPPLKRYVAVKTIKAEFLSTPGALERFRREAELSSQLKHPNIVTVYDYEEVVGGDSYIVTEVVEGGITLRERLQEGNLSLQEISSIINQIASALDYAYDSHNIVHRDIKPSNVFFEGGKRVAIGDFGIAKDVSRNTQLTSMGEGVGTPDYMSPEQAMGDPLDRRSDVYALGVVLFEMLTGSLPFKGDTPISVVMGHIQRPVPAVRSINPDIPQTVEAVVTKALSKKREDRFATSGDLARAMEAAVKGVPSSDATLAAVSYHGAIQNSTMGMGAAQAQTPPVVTRELNVVTELETQGRYQEAFDRLFTLQTQYPGASGITTRYQTYLTQGYQPSSHVTGSVGNFQGLSMPTSNVRTATPPPSQYNPTSTGNTGNGLYQSPAKKSSLPLILGIGGVVAVVAIVILVIVLASSSSTKGGTTTTAAVATVVTTTVPVSTTAATTTVATTAVDTAAAKAAQVNKDGEALIDKGDFSSAAEKFKEAVKLAPGTALYHDNLANAYNQTKEYALAENEARLALSLDPNVARYNNNLGVAVYNLSKRSDAERYYREAVRLKPSEALYHGNLARVLVDLGKPQEAADEANRAITLYDNDVSKDKTKNLAEAHNTLGESLEDQSKSADAEKAYREAIKLAPTVALYEANLSSALYGQKKYPEAEAEARKAVSLDPNYSNAHNLLGLALESQNKYGDAVTSYSKAAELSPKTALYQRNLAGALYAMKRYPEAESAAITATQLDPNNARGFNLLGISLYAQKKDDASIAAYIKAIQLNNKETIYFSNIGLAYEATNQPIKAREAYQKALELDPANKDAKDGLDRLKPKP